MPQIPISIPTLSGGVGRQSPTKRLLSEVEEMDNCLVSLEKSVEKRPPLSRIVENSSGQSVSSHLSLPFVDPVITFEQTDDETPLSNLNPDNLYFHFMDIDGKNKYCIVINRAGYSFDPVLNNAFAIRISIDGQDVIRTIRLDSFITVFRIEPTEWIKEVVDTTDDSGFSRAAFEYLTFGNKLGTKNNPQTYYVAGKKVIDSSTNSIKETFGSTDYNIGAIFWNKLIPLGFMPDNSAKDMSSDPGTFFASFPTHKFIHSGDVFSYKIAADASNSPVGEDMETEANNYWANVRDDVHFNVNALTLALEEDGQNRLNFGTIPQHPASVVKGDIADLNGYKAFRSLYHRYDAPFRLPPNTLPDMWETDAGYFSHPGERVDRDGGLSARGKGKVFLTREAYLDRPAGFYRTIKYQSHPYFQRVRTEGENSVLDYRRFPIRVYRDSSTGFWRIGHFEMKDRYSGTPLSNPGPLAVERKERIQAISIWKGRLWLATDHTIFSSSTDDLFNFWTNDILLFGEGDPIDIESNVGAFNQITHMIPFQEFLFVATAGSTQFEIRGGDLSTGISPMNVELRPSSFFSSQGMSEPQRMGNNLFFATPGYLLMYVGSSVFNNEYSASVDMSSHARGYLPKRPGLSTVSTTANTLFLTDVDNPNYLYLFNNKIQGDKLLQNSLHRWIFSIYDNIIGIKAFDTNLFLLSKRASGTSGSSRLLVAYNMSLVALPATAPLIDWLVKVGPGRITFDPTANLTHLTLPHWDPEANQVILPKEWDDVAGNNLQAYTNIPVLANRTVEKSGVVVTSLVLEGNWASQIRSGLRVPLPLWAGRSYTMNVELSTMFARNQQTGQVYPGVLNLKKITLRHFNTGQYRVEIERNNRESSIVEQEPMSFGDITDPLGQLRVEKQGELVVKILSYSDRCKINIVSDYPTPCNIANIDIVATGRPGDTSIQR